MDALEQLLTDHLAQAAESADPRPPDRAEVVDAAVRRRQRRRARRGLLVAAVALVAAGLASATVGDDRSRTDIVDSPSTTVDDPTTTSTTTSTTSAPTTVPTTVPAGPAAPPAPQVIESLALRPDGIGELDFGTPMADVVAAVTAELGPPTIPGEPVTGPLCTEDPTATVSDAIQWPGVTLYFAGQDADSLRLVGWHVALLPDATFQLRMADGPAMSDPISAWESAYGDALELRAEPDDGDGSATLHVAVQLSTGRVSGVEVQGSGSGRVLSLSAGARCDWGD